MREDLSNDEFAKHQKDCLFCREGKVDYCGEGHDLLLKLAGWKPRKIHQEKSISEINPCDAEVLAYSEHMFKGKL